MESEDFYIGYLPKMPKSSAKFVKAVLLPLLFIASVRFRHAAPVNENVPKRVINE